jgi:hypothetical protein
MPNTPAGTLVAMPGFRGSRMPTAIFKQ